MSTTKEEVKGLSIDELLRRYRVAVSGATAAQISGGKSPNHDAEIAVLEPEIRQRLHDGKNAQDQYAKMCGG